jgi:hypothetical protein
MCYLDAKINSTNEDCTYFSTMNYGYSAIRQVKTSINAVPISPHLHGI